MELNLLTREQLPENAFTVSRSRMGVWHNCQYKHHLIYNREARREFTTGPMALGKAIHRHWEHFYEFWLNQPVGFMSTDEINEISSKIFESETDKGYESSLNVLRASTLLLRYAPWAAENDTFVPLATEIELFVSLEMNTPDGRPIYLHAILDLLFELDGIVGFIDHKSGQQFWQEANAYFDAQLAFYFIVLHLLNIEAELAFINNINTYNYKSLDKIGDEKLFRRIPVHRSRMNVDEYLDNLRRAVKQLLNLKYPTKNLDKHCSSCQFQDICDMELRGLNSEPLIQQFDYTDLEIEFEVDI